jgi:hypothetical protein
MSAARSTPPAGVVLGSLTEQVFDILAGYTAFPWPVLVTQAKRCGVDLAALTPSDLDKLAPHLAVGVERYTSPQKGAAVKAELVALAAKRRGR